MKYEWTQGTEEIGGVVETWACEGEMFRLEIQEQDNELVVGTVWAETPATLWDTADYECVLEHTYESIGAAKHFLEIFDRERAEDQARYEERMDALDREWEEFQRSVEN